VILVGVCHYDELFCTYLNVASLGKRVIIAIYAEASLLMIIHHVHILLTWLKIELFLAELFTLCKEALACIILQEISVYRPQLAGA
jgi:hypothetical protein